MMTNAQAALLASARMWAANLPTMPRAIKTADVTAIAEQYKGWLDAQDRSESDKRVKEAQMELDPPEWYRRQL